MLLGYDLPSVENATCLYCMYGIYFQKNLMRKLPWQKIILSILVLTILIVVSGCQSKIVKDVGNSMNGFTQVGSNLEKVITNLMSGMGNIGQALADHVNNIVKGMTGH